MRDGIFLANVWSFDATTGIVECTIPQLFGFRQVRIEPNLKAGTDIARIAPVFNGDVVSVFFVGNDDGMPRWMPRVRDQAYDDFNDARYVNVTGDTMTGDLQIGVAAGGPNKIVMPNTSGVAAPTVNPSAQSTGMKLVLYSDRSLAGRGDYGIGIENSTAWFSVPSSSEQWKWYGGTTTAMTLSGTGVLTLGNDAVASGQLMLHGTNSGLWLYDRNSPYTSYTAWLRAGTSTALWTASTGLVSFADSGAMTLGVTTVLSQLHNAHVGAWPNGTSYACFMHTGVASGGYGMLSIPTQTLISTGDAAGDIYLRPGLNDATYSVLLDGGGNHAFNSNHIAFIALQTGTGSNYAYNFDASDMTGGSAYSLRIGGFSGDTSCCFISQLVYDRTSTAAVNVTVDANGRVRRSTSSRRYKTNIETWRSTLDQVLGLRTVAFTGREDIEAKVEGASELPRHVGFIAEEVYEIESSVVTYGEDGQIEGLNYNGMIALCVNAIQELSAKVESLEARLAQS